MIRTEDVFARYGGEEFVVLARGIEHDNAGRFSERLRSAVEQLEIALGRGRAAGDHQRRLRVARRARATGSATAEGLVRLADARLYGAKAAGETARTARTASAGRLTAPLNRDSLRAP